MAQSLCTSTKAVRLQQALLLTVIKIKVAFLSRKLYYDQKRLSDFMGFFFVGFIQWKTSVIHTFLASKRDSRNYTVQHYFKENELKLLARPVTLQLC